MKRKRHGFGKLFNTSKRQKRFEAEYDEYDYEDEYVEDDYYADEDGAYDEDGVYYADEEGAYDEDGVYYADEEGAYDEDGVYYTYEEGAYEEDGVYYEDGSYESEEEVYYENEDAYAYLASDEGMDTEVSRETMEFEPVTGEYEEDSAYYADEDGTYEEEDAYYADEDGVYDEDDSYYADGEDYGYEDEYYGDEYEVDEEAPGGSGRRRRKKLNRYGMPREENAVLAFFEGLRERISSMTAMDRIVAATGAIVMVIVMVTGSVYASAKAVDAQVASFSEVGDKLDRLGVGGEDGLLAMADAKFSNAEVDALFEDMTEAETETGEDKNEGVAIGFNMTSVEKDLKIKFVKTSTNRLLSGIPFEVEVTGPDKKTTTWVDDDKDGIIYKQNLTPGSYQVALKDISALEGYEYYTGTQSVTVKDKIEYVKIDVIDEVKTESEVNVAAEDTAIHEQEAAPALQDTVEWVESTKTPINGTGTNGEYQELDKKKITDPLTVSVSITDFVRMSAPTVSGNEGGDSKDPGKGDDGKEGETSPGGDNGNGDNNGDKSDNNGNGGGGSEGGNTNPGGQDKPSDPYKVDSVTLNQSSITMTAGGQTASLTATVKLSGSTGDKPSTEVDWKSSNEQVVKVSGGTLTSVGAGSATITATSRADSSKSATCNVTVSESELKLTLSATSLSLKVGESSSKLTASISSGHEIAKTEWTTSNGNIATVSDGVVKGVSAGEATITCKVTTKANKTVEATCKVTVSNSDVKLTLSKTELTVFTELTGELKATIENNASGDAIEWTSDNTSIATVKVSDDKKTATITGVAAGTANVTVTVKRDGKELAKASAKITVRLNPKKDTTTKLKDNDGNQVYIIKDGKFVEATLADYYTADKFYILAQNVEYKYTGWQTIDGKTYYYDKNGKRVTGEQVIRGMKYTFDSDGALMQGSGNMGIDVSKHNGKIDWQAVKNSGVSYVIIRCGYRGSSTGAMIVDPNFKENINGASAAGLKVGVYYFSQAVNEVEAVEEASMVLSLVKGYKISYPIFIDIEGSGGRADKIDSGTRTAVANAFCKTIQNGGYTAGIYANKNWFETKMNTSSLTGYKLWLAQYAAAPTYNKTRYDMWQYTSKGRINGISTDVDLDISYLGY